MTVAEQGPASIERLGRLVLQFLDLSGDLERNRDDTAHAQGGGTVTYALDAGVLEVFLNCRDGRGRSASLHTGEWRLGGKPPPAAWDSYAARVALVTTDYLLSGSLPGQQGGMILMSSWHRKEMVRRLNPIVARLAGKVAEDYSQTRRRFEDIRQLPKGSAVANLPRSRLVDDEFLDDVRAYISSASPQASEIESYSATRLALRVIADDRLVEPLQQLERLVTDPIRDRIRTLERSIDASQSQLNELAHAASQWFVALRAECVMRGMRIPVSDEGADLDDGSRPDEKVRTVGALWDDARTVALMQWAAARRPRNDRLVFVTADNVVFDAYRRWYAHLKAGMPSYAEPFFMRRLRQFAPGYNLINAGLAHGGELQRDLRRDDTRACPHSGSAGPLPAAYVHPVDDAGSRAGEDRPATTRR